MKKMTLLTKSFGLACALFLSAGCQDLSALMHADATLAEAGKPIVRNSQMGQDEKLAEDVEGASFRKAWLDLGKVADEYKDVLGGEDKSLFHRRSKGLLREAFEVVASDTGLQAYDEIRALQSEQTKLSRGGERAQGEPLGLPGFFQEPLRHDARQVRQAPQGD